jgi:hypothetical protein
VRGRREPAPLSDQGVARGCPRALVPAPCATAVPWAGRVGPKGH